jgi:hypothetical protein
MSKWQQHLECTRIIRMHPEWTDEQVLEEARMHKLEIDIVKEARREVVGENLPGETSSKRSF